MSKELWNNEILGLRADLRSGKFERLSGSVGLSAGKDFDQFPMYGKRKRCIVDLRGNILLFGGKQAEDRSEKTQVMVYQPAFYYKVRPLTMEPQSTGIGFHLREVEYYISAIPRDGFRLHPAFYDKKGKELSYILLSAYQAGLYVPASGTYFNDNRDTDSDLDLRQDRPCSHVGVKPISGHKKFLTRKCMGKLAESLGPGWHQMTIKTLSMDQMLMMIEYGTMNLQSELGLGVSMFEGSGTGNDSAYTGSTLMLGDRSGMAEVSCIDINGKDSFYARNGFVSVSYRGEEDPYGNLFSFVDGINIYGSGSENGGVPYICDNYDFKERCKSGHYKSACFSLSSQNGFWSAIGYGGHDGYDWLMMASETKGTENGPVGDYEYVTPDLDGFRLLRMGGDWHYQDKNGMFMLQNHLKPGVTSENFHSRGVGGRLIYVPQKGTHIYEQNIMLIEKEDFDHEIVSH